MTRRLLLLLASLTLVPGIPAARAAQVRVVILPIEVYNAPDLKPLTPGLQAMLASRIEGPGITAEVREKPGDAPWRVRTTVTQLGGTYSIDVSLEPREPGGREGTRTYRTARTPDAILPALEAVARTLRTYLAQETAAQPAPAPKVPAPARQVPAGPLGTAPQAATPAPREISVEAAITQSLRSHRMGPQVEGEAIGMVVTDVNGDEAPEILVLTNEVVYAFRDEGTGIARLWEIPTPPGINPAAISAADLDGNARPEVFVAGTNGFTPVSQSLEWFGSALASKGPRIPGFVRAVENPGPTPLVLAALPGTGKDLFAPGLRRVRWSGSGYQARETFAAPASAMPVNLDLVALGADERPFTVVTTQGDRLQLYGPGGTKLYETDEAVKGSQVYLEGEEKVRDHQDEDFYRVYGRTVGWKGPDGVSYLVVFKNYAPFGRVFQRAISFTHGQILMYRWDGLTLMDVVSGPKIPGMIPDIDLAPSGRAGGGTLYAVLVQSEGTLFKKYRFRVLAYDLPGPSP